MDSGDCSISPVLGPVVIEKHCRHVMIVLVIQDSELPTGRESPDHPGPKRA